MIDDSAYKDAQTKYTTIKAQAEEKEMNDPLNQALKEAKLAHARASTANIGKGRAPTPLQQLQAQYYKSLIDAQKNPQATGPAAVASPPAIRSYPAAPAREETDTEPAPLMRKGGLVRKFAVGGIVEDDDLEDDDGFVTPEVTGPAIGTATDLSAQARQP